MGERGEAPRVASWGRRWTDKHGGSEEDTLHAGTLLREVFSLHISTAMIPNNFYSVSNWDVLNENIEGQWLELNTGNLEFTQTMYTQMHQLQPEAGLFMNEYSIVTNGKFSSVSIAYCITCISVHNFIFLDLGLPTKGRSILSEWSACPRCWYTITFPWIWHCWHWRNSGKAFSHIPYREHLRLDLLVSKI